jgi:hypothetical protein
MPTVWIRDLEVPESADPGDSFYVNIKIWYTSWPWWLGGKMRQIFSNFNREGIMLDERRSYFRPWFFFGSKLHSYEVHDIEESTTYFGDIGWSD